MKNYLKLLKVLTLQLFCLTQQPILASAEMPESYSTFFENALAAYSAVHGSDRLEDVMKFSAELDDLTYIPSLLMHFSPTAKELFGSLQKIYRPSWIDDGISVTTGPTKTGGKFTFYSIPDYFNDGEVLKRGLITLNPSFHDGYFPSIVQTFVFESCNALHFSFAKGRATSPLSYALCNEFGEFLSHQMADAIYKEFFTNTHEIPGLSEDTRVQLAGYRDNDLSFRDFWLGSCIDLGSYIDNWCGSHVSIYEKDFADQVRHFMGPIPEEMSQRVFPFAEMAKRKHPVVFSLYLPHPRDSIEVMDYARIVDDGLLADPEATLSSFTSTVRMIASTPRLALALQNYPFGATRQERELTANAMRSYSWLVQIWEQRLQDPYRATVRATIARRLAQLDTAPIMALPH